MESPLECPECGTEQVAPARFCGTCQFELTLISTHQPVTFAGWSIPQLSDEPADDTDYERALRTRKGKITLTGYVQPGANGYRILPDDVRGAARVPVEVSTSRIKVHHRKYVQEKDHIEVYGKWKKHRYVQARRITNITTDVTIYKRSMLRILALLLLLLLPVLLFVSFAEHLFFTTTILPNTPLLWLTALAVIVIVLTGLLLSLFRDKG